MSGGDASGAAAVAGDDQKSVDDRRLLKDDGRKTSVKTFEIQFNIIAVMKNYDWRG